jgi:hypothetical protein
MTATKKAAPITTHQKINASQLRPPAQSSHNQSSEPNPKFNKESTAAYQRNAPGTDGLSLQSLQSLLIW